MQKHHYKLPEAELSASSSIKVEILTAGENSYNVPEALDLVTVRDLDRKRTFEFRIDNPEESIPPCVEYFARHVSQNTIANVTDSEGNIYRLLLDDVKRRPCLDAMTRLEDRIVEAKYRRELGNTCFRASLYEVALRRYEESLRCTDYCHVLFHDSSDLPSADRETLFSFLNAAACHLKLKNYEDTVKFCNRALDLDRDNAKAYYRRGSAYIYLGYSDKAQQDLNRAVKLDSSLEKQVRKRSKSILKIEQTHKAKMRKIFSGAFG